MTTKASKGSENRSKVLLGKHEKGVYCAGPRCDCGYGSKALSGFTPGPWEMFENRNGTIKVIGDSMLIFEECKMEKANAHLIAAAPELLEACKQAIEAIYDVCPIVNVDGLQYNALNALKQAIAKATNNV